MTLLMKPSLRERFNFARIKCLANVIFVRSFIATGKSNFCFFQQGNKKSFRDKAQKHYFLKWSFPNSFPFSYQDFVTKQVRIRSILIV